ncbi:MAG TPA: hypothetical protein VEA40_08450 [Ramlibacter sp.]|nr:hypothetical protein [Ramlibacter sp.]
MSPEQRKPQRRRWSDGLVPADDPRSQWTMSQQWPLVVTALAEEAVDLLRVVGGHLERQAAAGAVRVSEAQALRRAMARLQLSSQRAQQITRLASGRIRQHRERVDIGKVLQSVMAERSRDFDASHVVLRLEPQPLAVLLDGAVASGIVHTLADWVLTFGSAALFRIDPGTSGTMPRLEVEVTRRPRGDPDAPAPRRRLHDGLQWVLLRQLLASAGLEIALDSQDTELWVVIEFPRTFTEADGMTALELPRQPARAPGLDPVLVVASDPELLREALEALAVSGFETLGAATARDAWQCLRQQRPGSVVLADDARGGDFDELRAELLGVDGPRPLIEVVAKRRPFHLHGFQGFDIPWVAREDLHKELGATLLFELAKVG